MALTPGTPGLGLRPFRPAVLSLCVLLLNPLATGQEARITVNPDRPQAPIAERLEGFVGWRASPNLMNVLVDVGAQRATYRRTLFVHQLEDAHFIGADFALARAAGMATWLTCVGTPKSLSPNPDADGQEFNTGVPQYARYAPTDPAAWADLILDYVDQMEVEYGIVPDYVEIWNEPERLEWFKGSADDYVEMYAPAASRMRAQRPGLRVGGPGLAGWFSSMSGNGSFLLQLVESCAALQVPLDFVSWHNYAPSTELLYHGISRELKALAAARGMPPLETVVSEWNVYPAAEAEHAIEMDGAHGAANLAGLLASAHETGLDRNFFFLDYDEDNDGPVTDLMGQSLGLISQHGIRKPSARMLTFVLESARAPQLEIQQYPAEWNVRVQGSVDGGRMRLIVSNDSVGGLWVFAKRSRENGMDPGWLHPLWVAAGGPNATEASLMAQGLTQAQAAAVLIFTPESLFFDRMDRVPRQVVIEVGGTQVVRLDRVWRFTSTVNAPVQHQPTLLPFFQAAEDYARLASAQSGAAFLVSEGYAYTAADLLAITSDFLTWAASEGIANGVALRCNRIIESELRDSRLANEVALNALPETVLRLEDPAAAGVLLQQREIQFWMDPETAYVIEATLSASLAQ